MLKLSRFVVCVSLPVLLPLVAFGAGTYYNTGVQQRSYANTSYSSYRSSNVGAQGAINNGYTPYNTNARYTVGTNVRQQTVPVAQQQNVSSSTKNGFYMGLNLSHEYSRWEMNMKTAGSSLHYDDVSWNILDVNAGYKFANTSLPFQIDAGFRYGMQWDKTTMIDDDITQGGYAINDFIVNTTTEEGATTLVATQTGHALSIGKSSDGKMMGFNIGLGLTDAFSIGKLKMTPSIGWRYLKYKLKTTENYGLSVDTTDVTNNCVSTGNGEIQCGPVIVFFQESGGLPVNQAIEGVTAWFVQDEQGNPIGNAYLSGLEVPGAGYYASTEGTLYYSQSGTSHEYNVAWSGPYIAMDMEYEINANNLANMRVELGLPGYKSEGDQPYRPDWQHPTSVKDEAGILSAMHLGLVANWQTALTDSIALSLGVTYDYYKTDKADATTNLNPSYWETQYIILEALGYSGNVGTENYNATMHAIDNYRASGWKIEDKEEIKSMYRSLGARVGIVARF